jgi:tryptophan synthase beta chain
VYWWRKQSFWITISIFRPTIKRWKKIDVIACEPLSCPSFTKGKYAYDFGDMAMMTPLVKMHTLGSSFLPPANHSGGLRYHGMSYHLSHLLDLGLIRAKAYGQKECFEAGVVFAKQEGIIPAPEGKPCG